MMYPSTLSQQFNRDIMSLRIIATGGTFDKHYDPIAGTLGVAESVLPDALKRARLTEDMQDQHREQILAACKRAAESRIVIVHGTDTMRETAAVIAGAQLPKTIVLTGAMVPYQLAGSDAMFNLGSAITAAHVSRPGVWIVMHAQVFPWNEVSKNRTAGVFERAD
jgi:L-asparaginase